MKSEVSMKKMRNKSFFAVCMIMVLLAGVVLTDSYQISAEENDGTDLVLNPLYENVLDVAEEAARFEGMENSGIMPLEEPFYGTEKGIIDYLKSQMVQRNNTIVCLLDSSEYRADSFNYIFERAIAHTEGGRGQEGDSLAFGWKSRKGKILETGDYVQLTYYLTYYTDFEQEKVLTEAVNLAMDEMALAGKSDYEKIKTIYQYVCDNVNYDSNMGELKYTPYSALCNGTAVCQGYAVLFYRFCTEADISTRVIGGIGNEIPHAWNIVKLNGKYYNLDSTWDGEYETTTYNWFLKSDADFSKHIREDAYLTEEFYTAYPMAEMSYNPQSADDYYTGLRNEDGIWKYYENGVWNTEKYGYVEYNGGKFLIAYGKVAVEINGLALDPTSTADWYFLSHGQVQTQHMGLALYDGEWFYIEDGKLATEMVGYVPYDGSLFYVAGGRILQEVNGLAQDPVTGKWYYLSHGQVQTQYTGLAEYDGEWFYVENGVLADTYIGYVNHNGTDFYVEYGMVKG